MNSVWLKTILVLSLACNCMIAGAFTYKYFIGPQAQQAPAGPGQQQLQSGRLLSPEARQELQGKITPVRQQIQDDRNRIVELLRQDTPDRRQIDAALALMSTRQANIQSIVMDRIIQELQTMTPEQKTRYLADMQDPRCWRGMFGMGRGKERGRGHGEGRRGRQAVPPQ
jgi:uncharacterized membrane protein